MIIAGIDVGISGAVCIKKEDTINVQSLPTVGKIIDVEKLHSILKEADHIFIEKSHAMPKQGVVSSFNFGYTYGLIEAAARLTNAKVEIVHSKTWKNLILKGTAKDKDAALVFAHRLYPDLIVKKSDHNKADAILIAEYGRRILGGLNDRG